MNDTNTRKAFKYPNTMNSMDTLHEIIHEGTDEDNQRTTEMFAGEYHIITYNGDEYQWHEAAHIIPDYEKERIKADVKAHYNNE